MPMLLGIPSDGLGEVPTSSKLEEFAWRHQKLHDQIRILSRVSETLLQDMLNSSHDSIASEPATVKAVRSPVPSQACLQPLESAPAPSALVGQSKLLQRSNSQASIPSVDKLQSDFLCQIGMAGHSDKLKRKLSHQSLSVTPEKGIDAVEPSKRDGDSVRSDSPGLKLCQRNEGTGHLNPMAVVPAAPAPPPAPGHTTGPPQDLPGLLENPDEGAISPSFNADDEPPHRNVSFLNIASMAQTTILDNWNKEGPREVAEERRFNGDAWDSWDVGSRIFLHIPMLLYVLMLLLVLAEVGMILYLKIKGVASTTSRSNSLACAVIYLLAASSSGSLLRWALQSEEFRLALGNLSSFLADFELDWSNAASTAWCKYILLWFGFVALVILTQVLEMSRTLQEMDPSTDAPEIQILVLLTSIFGVINLSACSTVIALVAAAQSHFLRGLDKCLDCWCYDISEHADFAFGVHSWNRMQALLKCIGRHLEGTFISMQAIAFLGFVYTLGSIVAMIVVNDSAIVTNIVFDGLSSMPLLLLFLLCLGVSANGAALTEKCRTIPSLVNQMPSEEPVEHARQYLVHFISDSAAGFIVKDVPLTREIFAKQFILIAGLTSGLFAALSRLSL